MSIQAVLFTILLSLSFSSGLATAGDAKEVASDVIAIHQPLARRILGKEIYLLIEQSQKRPNAFASFNGPGGSPRIRILSTLLEEFEDDEIAGTVCHELGHFFGNLSLGLRDVGLAIEAEADYFEGKCLARYLTQIRGMSRYPAEREAIRIAKNEAQAFERRFLNSDFAIADRTKGIMKTYSNPNCRLLTVIQGIRGERRPSCWFNPEESRSGL